MNWFKKFKKKEIVLPFKREVLTLEELGNKMDVHPPYFRIRDDKLFLYKKSPIGAVEEIYKLPLRMVNISHISHICQIKLKELNMWDMAKKVFEKEIIIALHRFWNKF